MSGMRAEQVRQLAAWLAQTDIALLELRGPGQTLLLRHDGADVEIAETDTAAAVATAEAADADAQTIVAAPFLGVFLQRHPLRDDALAAPGTKVLAGQPLGLLQIGPLLLPVPSPVAATVHEWLVADGTVVGYGTPLVALRDAEGSR